MTISHISIPSVHLLRFLWYPCLWSFRESWEDAFTSFDRRSIDNCGGCGFSKVTDFLRSRQGKSVKRKFFKVRIQEFLMPNILGLFRKHVSKIFGNEFSSFSNERLELGEVKKIPEIQTNFWIGGGLGIWDRIRRFGIQVYQQPYPWVLSF